jgi:hypothetical protein
MTVSNRAILTLAFVTVTALGLAGCSYRSGATSGTDTAQASIGTASTQSPGSTPGPLSTIDCSGVGRDVALHNIARCVVQLSAACSPPTGCPGPPPRGVPAFEPLCPSQITEGPLESVTGGPEDQPYPGQDFTGSADFISCNYSPPGRSDGAFSLQMVIAPEGRGTTHCISLLGDTCTTNGPVTYANDQDTYKALTARGSVTFGNFSRNAPISMADRTLAAAALQDLFSSYP